MNDLKLRSCQDVILFDVGLRLVRPPVLVFVERPGWSCSPRVHLLKITCPAKGIGLMLCSPFGLILTIAVGESTPQMLFIWELEFVNAYAGVLLSTLQLPTD